MKEKPCVLMIDDSPQDVALVEAALGLGKQDVLLRSAPDGAAGAAYMEGAAPFQDREANPLPALILLDIQMPRMDGFEFLRWLRARPEPWRRVPVVMLTTSHDFVEVRKAYDQGANSFIVKPTGFDDLSAIVDDTLSYWLKRNRRP